MRGSGFRHEEVPFVNSGADAIRGGNRLYGNGGNDTLDAGRRGGTMYGGAGNDTYIVDTAQDVVSEAAASGTDLVQASVSYTLGANVENLTLTGKSALTGTGNSLANVLTGNAGNNLLLGGLGDDTLFGGAGDDTLVGGAGADILSGGAGADVFQFVPADGPTQADRITDFAASEDRIDLSGFSNGQPFAFIGGAAFTPDAGPQLRFEIHNGMTAVQFIPDPATGLSGSSLTLNGAIDLTAANFVGAVAPVPPAETPTIPVVETPPPVVEVPALPVAETPTVPVVEAPPPPVAEVPATPVVDAPATPVVDVPPAGAIIVSATADLQSLVDSAGAGATFWLEAGVHRLQSITPHDNQSFYGAEGAVMSGARELTGFSQSGANWVISGQTQEGERRILDEGLDAFPRHSYPDQVYVDDKPLLQVASVDDLGPGKFFFDYTADKIYLRDNPAGHSVEAAVSPFAFDGGATGVTIQGLVIEKYAAPVQYGAIGYHTAPVDWLIQDNEVRLNFGVGILAGDGTQILGNFVHDNGEMGLGGNGDNILVANNEIASNGYFAGIDPYWEGGGSKFAETHNLVVRDNYSHDNTGYGLWTDIDNINTLYEGNRVEFNTGGGINHEISYDAVIRNNTFLGNGADVAKWLWGGAIQIQNSQNVEVYGNKIDMTDAGNGIALIQQNRGVGAYGVYVTEGNNVHDNLLVSTSSDIGNSGAIADYDEAGMLSGGNIFNNNEYSVTDGADDHWVWGEFYDWNAFRAASSQDASSTLTLL